MPVPDKADPRPVYQQISADLRARLGRREFDPSGKLPPNTALAGEYGVSQETVRKALRDLTDQGLVTAHSTIGTFVTEQQPREDRVTLLEKRVDELEAQVMDLRAAAGTDRTAAREAQAR